jgi:hypothetical protein
VKIGARNYGYAVKGAAITTEYDGIDVNETLGNFGTGDFTLS